MYLNDFAAGLDFLDLTGSDEFTSLLQSAADLGIPHDRGVRYVSRETVVNHHRLHFLEWGDPAAPPLLLLHGGNQSAHSWDLVSLHLADRYHIFALDQRGHGDSEWARDADYGPGAMAEDALAFLAQQGVARPLVMGHSMGGMVTMTLTGAAPHVPRALVIVDVGPEISQRGAEMIRNFITHNVEFDSIDAFVERVHAYDPLRLREHQYRTARYNLIQRSDGKYISKSDRLLHDGAFRERARAFNEDRRDVAEGLAAFPGPILVVRGERSNILEADAAERFVAGLPTARLVTVPDCAHNVQTQNTPGFLAAVQPFLHEIDG